jgi:hypothetical protein
VLEFGFKVKDFVVEIGAITVSYEIPKGTSPCHTAIGSSIKGHAVNKKMLSYPVFAPTNLSAVL